MTLLSRFTPALRACRTLLAVAFLLAAAASAQAVLVTLPAAALSAPAVAPGTIVNFGEVSLGTPIHDLTIKGFTFSENTDSPSATVSSGGPGTTLNLTIPSAQSGGGYSPASYVLTVTMPAATTQFGFGFAILDFVPTANAVTITVYYGATNLGSITYPGVPDPTPPFFFDGGFAGIGSTDPFTSARITFGPTATAFAIDNFAVPEPGSLLLLAVGGALAGLARRRPAK